MEANRPISRSLAHGLLLALALGLHAIGAAAQAPARVVPPDSAGLFNRLQLERFMSGLPLALPRLAPAPVWQPPAAGVRRAIAAFDSGVRVDAGLLSAEAAGRRAVRRFASFQRDTVRLDERHGLFGLSPNTADVTFDGNLRFQISTNRQKNLACTPALAQNPASGCSGGFSAPRLDNIVQLQSTGVFGQRGHINIDFDSKADNAARNIINAYYLGLPDEKLQRIDIGTQIFTPPPSRFLTTSIPSNNFGISAQMAFGPVHVQGILATQKGNTLATRRFTVGSTTQEPVDRLTRDLDYEPARVFWTVDPRTLNGFPVLDALNAGAIPVPAAERPAELRIYRYVSANRSSGANANYDGITAVAQNGNERTGAVRWRLLKPNVDYWLDPSGLWFILAASARIDPNDYLAVSYKTASGQFVGSFPSTDNPAAQDSLRLIYLPNRGPASPVFYHEMRQFYRIAGSSLTLPTLRASILVANSERPAVAPGTYLSALGLAVQSDPAVLDIENRVFPRLRDPGASQVINDFLIAFPSAQPFSAPSLTTAERNDSMYVTPEYLLLTQGPPSKFTIRLQYTAKGGTDNRSIRLDAIEITDKSERIDVNGRRLVRDIDYRIDYATGRVDFVDPATLFGNGEALVTASFEQRGIFAQAPTTIAGATATWHLGQFKSISAAALYQAEASGYTRPQIGFEPKASFLGGFTADMLFDAPGVTALFNRLVTKRSTALSRFHVTGELAFSRPDPNRSGDAFLEEFEDDRNVLIPALENAWIHGSVPKSAAGLTDILPIGFDSADAVQLTFQNLVPGLNDTIVRLSPHDIDPTIALTQSRSPTIEPVLWMAVHADTAGGLVDHFSRSHWTQPRRNFAPRWRSLTVPLSLTGTDFSHNDYLEFALYETSDKPIETSKMRIVFDLGRVSEDALSMAPTNFHILTAADTAGTGFRVGDTVFTGRQYVGVHRLDTEKTFYGSWNAAADDNGILADRPDSLIGPNGVIHFPAMCQDSLGYIIHFVPWGDLSSRCSNKNAFADTEDLDGDNLLDAQGSNDDVFRYVLDLSRDSAKYFVRSHTVTDPRTGAPVTDSRGRTARWTIYRVPLHTADDTIGIPDIHLVKQMRMTFVTPADNGGADSTIRFAMALMKFTGAAWIARAERPIATLSGPTAQVHGQVLIGTVSTQDSVELGYTSPPGIGNATATVAASSNQFSQQINEKSLRIQAFDLQRGERAEGYLRLLSGSRNLLAYRQLRVWMRGRPGTPGWNDGRLQAYIKVGSDAYNFYLYRAPVHTSSWDPELIIDLQTWRDLRAQIENARLNGAPPSGSVECRGGDSTAYVACTPDGSYLVQVRDPQINPPNLAAVQELAGGFYYGAPTGLAIAQTELWIDDIRVSGPVSTTGVAGAINAQLLASDVATLDLSGIYQSGNFRQMSQLPTYQNATSFAATSTVHLERFLSPKLGLSVPVTVSSNWSWVDPQLVDGTDVETGGLRNLRRPKTDATVWSISVRDPLRPTSRPLTRLLLHPLSFTASGSTALNITSLAQATSSTWATALNYSYAPLRRAYSLGLGGLVKSWPRWLRESTAGRGIGKGTFSPLPASIQLTSTLNHTMGDLQAFQQPVRVLADTILKPVTSEQFLWRNGASMTWQPIGMLSIATGLASTRDLREYPDSTSIGRIANAQHRSLFGADVGVERDRNLNNSIRIAPRFSSWLGSEVNIGTNFFLSRSLASRNPVRVDGDTAGAYILPQTLSNSRFVEYHFTVDPKALSRLVFRDSSAVTMALGHMRPVDFIRRRTLESTFDLATFDPGLGYQFALGGLGSFLTRNGQQAVGATNATATTFQAAVDLLAGVSGQLQYSSTVSDRYQQNTGAGFLKTNGTLTTWPRATLEWSRGFRGGIIANVSAGGSLQRDNATSESPLNEETSNLATSLTMRATPHVDVVLRNGLLAHFSAEFDKTDGSFAGNTTRGAQTNVLGTVSWSMRLPQALSRTRRTMRTEVTVSENSTSSCIQRTGDSSCVETYGLHRFEASTSFAAVMQHGVQSGLSFSYVHNAVVSQGVRSMTLTLSMFLSVPLSAWGM